MGVSTSLSLVLATSVAADEPQPAKHSECAEITDLGERQLLDNDLAHAEATLTAAVAACRTAREPSARPFMALGTLLFQTKRLKEAIVQFYEAVEREPTLGLAYMNLSAAHQQLGEYEKSVEAGKHAIELAHTAADKQTEAKANFNVGLAMFSDAAAKGRVKDTSAEAYFTASRDLDPSLGGNYFYLAVIAQVMHGDAAKAKNLYQRGCELKYAPACKSLDKRSR